MGNACSKAACSLRHLVNLLLRNMHPASQPRLQQDNSTAEPKHTGADL